jgi:RND family efflux transporter MFP subunit
MTDEVEPEEGPPEPRPPEPRPPASKRRRRRRHWLFIAIAVIVVVVVFIAGALPRIRQSQRVRSDTEQMRIPHVSVGKPQRAAPAQEIVLPGAVQAYTSAPIFARANGYVRKWYFDIGAKVKAGQLLADIEVPEVRQQLQQARGSLATAEANLRLSELTAKRFTALAATKAVSQQEVDTAVNTYKANQATVAANQANVRQFEDLLSYSQVRAPFDGVISQRNIDVGDLINAGSSTVPNTALFEMVQSGKLRVYITVPEPYASAMTTGMVATLTLAAFPGRKFAGKVTRTANAIDPTTRTLRVEIQVDNPTGELFAGAFSEVHIEVPATQRVFVIPVEALLFRSEGLQIAIVTNDRVTMKSVTPGRDFGTTIEIVKGLTGDETFIVSPPNAITNGDLVRIVQPTTEARRAH